MGDDNGDKEDRVHDEIGAKEDRVYDDVGANTRSCCVLFAFAFIGCFVVCRVRLAVVSLAFDVFLRSLSSHSFHGRASHMQPPKRRLNRSNHPCLFRKR